MFVSKGVKEEEDHLKFQAFVPLDSHFTLAVANVVLELGIRHVS